VANQAAPRAPLITVTNESVATASSQEARAADTHGSALGGGRHGAPRARAVLGGLIESDDEFCLQLDVPAKARERWDVELLAAWGHAQNEYVCDRRCRRKQHVIEAPKPTKLATSDSTL
jgi:hypothetical protein